MPSTTAILVAALAALVLPAPGAVGAIERDWDMLWQKKAVTPGAAAAGAAGSTSTVERLAAPPPTPPPITVERLVALEERFGGFVQNVPRQVVSAHDPRSKQAIARGGMTGGDRMARGRHNYGATYARYLAPLKDVTSVAEVGILKGSGVALWCELFPRAQVHGFDVNLVNIRENMAFLKSRGAFSRGHLQLHEFDQFAPVVPTREYFALVIDDGFHSEDTVKRTWEAFRPWLRADGVYIVEDCECAAFRSYMARAYASEYSVEYRVTNPNSQLVVITTKPGAQQELKRIRGAGSAARALR